MEPTHIIPIGSLLIGIKELVSSIKDRFDISGTLRASPPWTRALWTDILSFQALCDHAVGLGLDVDCLDESDTKVVSAATRSADRLIRDLTNWVVQIQHDSTNKSSLSAVSESICVHYQSRVEDCRCSLARILNRLQSENARLAVLSMQDPEALSTYVSVNKEMAGKAELAFDDERAQLYTSANNLPTSGRLSIVPQSKAPIFGASSYQLKSTPCGKFCRCNCHTTLTRQFPLPTRNLLSRLFHRINGSPKLFHSCNFFDCRKNKSGSTRIVVVHARLLRQVVTLSALSRGIQINIKVHPILSFESEVIRFSETGDYRRFQNLIKQEQASPLTAGPDGWTLLHNAVFHGHFEIAKFLLSLQVDTDVTEVKGRSVKAAHFAKFRALMKRATENERLLADLFSDSAEFMYDFELTPIHSAVLYEYEVADSERPNLQTLLKFAQDVSQVPNSKEEWVALRWKYRERSPLFRQIIDWFEKGWVVGETGNNRFSRLIEQADSVQSWTPLQWAAFVDHVAEFVQLVDVKADIFKITSSGRNMLHQAAESGTSDVLEYILSSSYHKAGLEINHPDIWGETPLHIAAAKGPESAVHLLDHGASVDAIQEDNQVPLTHTRYLSCETRLRCVRLLSAMPGRHLNCQDAGGAPPLHHLIDDIPCVRELIEKGSSLYTTDNYGKNIVHVACKHDHLETLSFLLSEYAVESRTLVEELDNNGDTPLITAFRSNSFSCARLLLRKISSSILTDRKGWSLLHHAVNAGDAIILRLVLSISGIDPRARTSDGETAADIARRRGYRNDMLDEILRRKGNSSLADLYSKVQPTRVPWELYAAYR